MRKAIAVILLLCLVGLVCAQTQTTSTPATVPTPKTMISRADLEKRLSELKTQHEQTIAQVHAIEGAIQDCQYWLDQLKPVESTPTPTP